MRRELTALLVAASATVSSAASADDPPPREPLVFVADPKMSVEPTVRSVDSLFRVFYRYEDALPPLALDETRASGKALGVLARTAKLVLADVPLAELATIVVHEAGGHGARARELGLDPQFVFYLPVPYRTILSPHDHEPAAGYTRYLGANVVEDDEAIIGTLGGMEANWVHAWWIDARILRSDGWVHHGDLLVYAFSKLGYADAFLAAPDQSEASNDVSIYVTELQQRSNGWRNEDRRRIANRLAAAYVWNLADPTLLYSLYATFAETLWRGRRVSRMPLPEIGGTTMLLSPRFALSPFGAENILDLFLAREGRLLDVYARVGSSGLAEYYGAGARLLGVRAGDRVRLGAELDVWRQPEILLDERAVYDRPYRLGMNAGVFADVRVAGIVGITGKLASKTPGWVVGQPIGGGVHGYLGLSLAWQ